MSSIQNLYSTPFSNIETPTKSSLPEKKDSLSFIEATYLSDQKPTFIYNHEFGLSRNFVILSNVACAITGNFNPNNFFRKLSGLSILVRYILVFSASYGYSAFNNKAEQQQALNLTLSNYEQHISKLDIDAQIQLFAKNLIKDPNDQPMPKELEIIDFKPTDEQKLILLQKLKNRFISDLKMVEEAKDKFSSYAVHELATIILGAASGGFILPALFSIGLAVIEASTSLDKAKTETDAIAKELPGESIA